MTTTNNNNDSPPALIDSYNARWIPTKKIAESFIPPKSFREIAKPASTIIVGPRGSGKTTILKMLQTSALENWTHREANKYRKLIDYTAVFIPADIVWSKQFKALGTGYLNDAECENLRHAVFTGQILQSLLKAIIERVEPHQSLYEHRQLNLTNDQTRELVFQLSSAWYLSPEIPSLRSLKRALRACIDEIWEFSNKERHLNKENRGQRFADFNFLQLDAFRACNTGIEIFNAITNESDGVWALLFDELEIAPDWVTERLKHQLRSHAPNVLLKLSLSPYTKDIDFAPDSASAMSGQDYSIVPLWNKYKKDSVIFAERLFTKLVHNKGKLLKHTPLDVLGPSAINGDSYNQSSVEAYKKGSKHQKLFSRLYSKDPGVKQLLNRYQVDPENLPVGSDKNASFVRKIFPTLVLRDFFLKTQNTESRGRKVYTIYSGTDTYLSATESNPRWLIGITSRLLNNYKPSAPRISQSEQAKQIDLAAESFGTLLKTIPVKSEILPPDSSLLDLIDKIGYYFFNSLKSQKLNPEPISTFIIDSNIPAEIEEVLGIALNSGAIVYVNKADQELILNNLKGKRFRLCYLLCPQYKINTRIGPSTPLSKILALAKRKTVKQVKKSNDDKAQEKFNFDGN